jgi:hypothetical protein
VHVSGGKLREITGVFMNKKIVGMVVICFVVGISGCASHGKASRQAGTTTSDSGIICNIPAGSPFSKIALGMSMKQVHDLIGEPTDQFNYSTGKAFIPFYFGRDMMRLEDLYKGLGRITYT